MEVNTAVLDRSTTTAAPAATRAGARTQQPGVPPVRHVPYVPKPTLGDELVSITFEIRRADLPATKSAIDEIRQLVGGRLEGPFRYAREHALTSAVIGTAAIGAAIHAHCAKGDPNYAR